MPANLMIIRLRKVKALMRKWDEFLNQEFAGPPSLQRIYLRWEGFADSGLASCLLARIQG